jgi:hypothetical protein
MFNIQKMEAESIKRFRASYDYEIDIKIRCAIHYFYLKSNKANVNKEFLFGYKPARKGIYLRDISTFINKWGVDSITPNSDKAREEIIDKDDDVEDNIWDWNPPDGDFCDYYNSLQSVGDYCNVLSGANSWHKELTTFDYYSGESESTSRHWREGRPYTGAIANAELTTSFFLYHAGINDVSVLMRFLKESIWLCIQSDTYSQMKFKFKNIKNPSYEAEMMELIGMINFILMVYDNEYRVYDTGTTDIPRYSLLKLLNKTRKY